MTAPAAIAARAAMLAAVALIGCRRPPPLQEPTRVEPPAVDPNVVTHTASTYALELTLQLPRGELTVGQTVDMTLIARNVTLEPIWLTAPQQTHWILRVWRHTGLAWEEVKRYPPTPMNVQLPWILGGRKTRTFHARIPVEPDWPTAETLRITAELAGEGDVVPQLSVTVRPAPPRGEPEKADR